MAVPQSSPGAAEGPSDAPFDDAAREKPTVLIADGPNRGERYRTWLEPTFEVDVGPSETAARAATTSSVDVGILGPGVPPDTKQALLEMLDLRAPFSRTIVVPVDDTPPMIQAPGFDVCCYAPVNPGELRDAAVRMARIAVYERTVATYFEYTTHAASLDVARREGNAASDRETLQERIDWLGDRLQQMRQGLDEADRAILLDSLETDPAGAFGGDVRKSADKRQPEACTDCGLDWQVDHGGDVGTGCDQLGAFVWKCRRCGTVQEAADPSHQRIA